MSRRTADANVPWLLRAQRALGLNQAQLASLLGTSSRTLQRWGGRPKHLTPRELMVLAQHLHRVDARLADEIARLHDTTLAALNVPPRNESQSMAVERATPLVDSVVCAAADVMALPPHSLRPALLAALDRAGQLHLDVETMRSVLRPPR
jgi:hypothetical protein